MRKEARAMGARFKTEGITLKKGDLIMEEKFSIEMNKYEMLRYYENKIVEDGIKSCSEFNTIVNLADYNTKEIKLRGKHNFENICAALAATREFVSEDTAVEAIKEFNAVEHRLEFVRNINGVKWYNDSASSSPSRTIAGLNAYDEEIVLIAGGYDKNLDYEILGKYIVEKVKALILIGNTAKKILTATMKEMKKANVEIPIYCAKTLEEAVEAAKQIAQRDQVVLFSPASASFDMFKNFADRGNQFKELVNKI